MSLSRLAAKCRACAYADICDHKRMEAVGVLPLPETQVSSTGNEVEIKINQGIDIDAITKEISRAIQVPERLLRGG